MNPTFGPWKSQSSRIVTDRSFDCEYAGLGRNAPAKVEALAPAMKLRLEDSQTPDIHLSLAWSRTQGALKTFVRKIVSRCPWFVNVIDHPVSARCRQCAAFRA